MKKTLTIHLVDGTKIERDLTKEKGFPLGAPANDQAYAGLCQFIAVNGFTDIDRTNAKEIRLIAPSQIKEVTIKFEP